MEKLIQEIIDIKIQELADSENLLECLNIKISLMNKDKFIKNEYERNEGDIDRMETLMKISKVKKIIENCKLDLQETYDRLISELHFEDLNIK